VCSLAVTVIRFFSTSIHIEMFYSRLLNISSFLLISTGQILASRVITHLSFFMLLEYTKVYKLKHEKCVKTPFLSCIFNYEVLDRREEKQRMPTKVSISHAESAFVSFSD